MRHSRNDRSSGSFPCTRTRNVLCFDQLRIQHGRRASENIISKRSRREGPRDQPSAQQDTNRSDSKNTRVQERMPLRHRARTRPTEERGNPGNRLMINSLLRIAGVYKAYEKYLIEQIKYGPMPQHIGIILDGNRRWATEKALNSTDGHWAGAKVGEEVLDWCLEYGIKTLTLYTFSTENFDRPSEEVNAVLKIVEEEAEKLRKDKRLHSQRVRVKALGRIDLLPEGLRNVLLELENETKDYDGHFLNVAIAYTGRAEIVDATKKIVEDIGQGNITLKQIDEDTFHKYLYTAHLPNPNPDLVIRTSGEERLSGFLLWQSAYSELVFVDVYWPEFRRIDFLRAIRLYQRRHRRFGR